MFRLHCATHAPQRRASGQISHYSCIELRTIKCPLFPLPERWLSGKDHRPRWNNDESVTLQRPPIAHLIQAHVVPRFSNNATLSAQGCWSLVVDVVCTAAGRRLYLLWTWTYSKSVSSAHVSVSTEQTDDWRQTLPAIWPTTLFLQTLFLRLHMPTGSDGYSFYNNPPLFCLWDENIFHPNSLEAEACVIKQ